MKIKASTIILLIAAAYVVFSPYQVAFFLGSRGLTDVVRYFRLLTIPIFVFIVANLAPRLTKVQVKDFVLLSLPVLLLLVLNVFQLAALPSGVVSTHVTGSVKYTSMFLMYQCIILTLKFDTVGKYRQILSGLLLLTFIGIVAQYPYLISQSGASIGSIINNFGQVSERVQTAGLFGGANGDANASVALFPIVLFFINKTTGKMKAILRIFIFTYYPLVLLYNGTRTALVISFPLILFLLYSNLSLKRMLRQLLFLPIALPFLYLFQTVFLSRAFSAESSTEGTFGWRISTVWKPAIDFTSENSPFLGFGSRGWEYLVSKTGLLSAGNEGIITPHNTYIWSYVCWGVFGAILYCSFLLILILKSYQASRSKDLETASLGKASFCAVIGYCIWSSISNSHLDQGWTVLLVIASLIASLQVDAPIRDSAFLKSENYE